MKKILLLLSMLMFIFTATVSAASAVFLKKALSQQMVDF